MKLEIPCSYQGGKQRLATHIVDIMFSNHTITEQTKFYDMCCGSGAFSIELINRGIHPNNITMIDNGCFGAFWQSVANDEFSLSEFKEEIDKLPSLEFIQEYLKNLSNQPVDYNKEIYHYLLLQAGAFGSKQIWLENKRWKNNTFRSYWLPTETSNRRSPVNPMMPMPETLYKRVENIVECMAGCITARQEDIFDTLLWLDTELHIKDAIIYVDPPYMNTTGYKTSFNVLSWKDAVWNDIPIYISEGYKLEGAKETYLLSKGRTKGNISGDVRKKPVEEWLNLYF